MTTAPGATEFQMAFSDTGGAAQQQGSLADAQRIQAVLLGHARAGDSQFGLDARSYLFQASDAATLSQLQSSAASLVGRYLPGVQVSELVVQLVPAAQAPQSGGRNTVVVGVVLGGSSQTAFPFAVLVSSSSASTVVSSLVF